MRRKIKTSPASSRELAALGRSIREARLRRELTQQMVAERASTTRQLIYRIEDGDPSVSIGSYAMVLQALGLLKGWGSIEDPLGDRLAEEQLRKRAPRERS